MTNLPIAASIFSLLLGAVLGRKGPKGARGPANNLRRTGHRDLQDLCSIVLPVIEDQGIVCKCTVSLLPKIKVGASCETIEPICILDEEDDDGKQGGKKCDNKVDKGGEERVKEGCEEEAPSTLFCTTPEMKADVDISALLAGAADYFSIDVCFDDVSILGFSLFDDLCIRSAIDAVAPGVLADGACNAAVGNTDCSSCTRCPDGGFKFDCSNIDAKLLSTCSQGFSPFAFGDGSHPDEIGLSLLDGLRR